MAWMPSGKVSAYPALLAALLATAVGCNATWMDFQVGRTSPVSRPVEEAEDQDADSEWFAARESADTAAEDDATADDESQLARIEASLEEYQARFPDPDGTLPPPVKAETQHTDSSVAPATPAPVIQPTADGDLRSAERASIDTPAAPQSHGASEKQRAATIGANQAVALDVPGADSESASAEPVDAPPSSLHVELLDVRPAGPGDGADPQSPSRAPNEPATMSTEPPGWAEWLAQLRDDVAQHPHHLDNQLRLRLLYMAMGQEDEAVRPPENVDPFRGELLTALCQTLAATRRAIENPASASEALDAVDTLQRLMRAQSPVVITKLALVTRVNSFGDYDAIEPPRFSSRSPLHVFCYTEVANFRSEPVGQGQLRTQLAAEMEIFHADGQLVWERAIPHIEDRVFTPRRDFFIPLEINLDAPLPAGEYVLKVTIEDKLGATTDQQRMRFEIGR